MIKPLNKISTIVLIFALCLIDGDLRAGAYIFAGDSNGIDLVTHSKNYNGTGGIITNKVCIVVGSTSATSLEIPIQNSIDRYNQLVAIEGNLLFGSSNDIPSGAVDIESALLHEIGHCIGMAHPNAAGESGLSGSDTNYTKTEEGTNTVFDINSGVDGIRGSSDDVRGDDVNLHWFLTDSNDPFTTPNDSVDENNFSRDILDLPMGNNFAANADRSVSTLLGYPFTEATMQQGQGTDEDQRALVGDDVNTLRFARSGNDHIAGTADDYSLNLVYGGISDAADCDITVALDTSTSFAVCRTSGTLLSGNNAAITSADVRYNENSNWFFTTKRIPSPSRDQLTVSHGGTVMLVDGGADSLLDNDTHPDLLPLNLSTQVYREPMNGNAILNTDGTFSYTHDGGQSDFDVFVYKTCVEDAGATNTCSYGIVNVLVTDDNTEPVLTAIGDQTINELETLNFTASASDSDLPAQTLTFSLSGEPSGANITTGGEFSFTPNEAQGPGEYSFDVIVTDNGAGALSDSENITVTVNEVNSAPILASIGNQSINELETLNFTAFATDSDLPALSLTFSLSGEPAGANITAEGEFSFTPTQAQGPGIYTFDVIVTDDGIGNLTDSETIEVIVNDTSGLCRIPNVTIPDNDANGVFDTLNVASSGILTDLNVAIDINHTWVGDLSISLIHADTGTELLLMNRAGGTSCGENDVLVVLDDEAATNVQDQCNTPIAIDGVFIPNVPLSGFDGLELAADWTLKVTDSAEADTGNLVSWCLEPSFNSSNTPPVMDNIGNQSVTELSTLNFTVTATDSDTPAQTLTFSLSGEPNGASITTGGIFSFTPTEAQGSNDFIFDVIVTDNGAGMLSDSETITVTVNEGNSAPILVSIGNQSIDELAALNFTATATDSDTPAQTLTFSLSGEPNGASITTGGIFSFTPTEAQGSNDFIFDVIVTDNGAGMLSDSETITVTVNEGNSAPILASIGDKTVNVLNTLNFIATATDADIPINTLSFSLFGEPIGASITTNGEFSFTPTEAQSPNDYSFDVIVTDNGVGTLSDSETITITVTDIIFLNGFEDEGE